MLKTKAPNTGFGFRIFYMPYDETPSERKTMFTVAREMIREDGQKVTMRVTSTEDKVEVTYSLAGSQEVETTIFTPIEADMLLDLLSINEERAGELNPIKSY